MRSSMRLLLATTVACLPMFGCQRDTLAPPPVTSQHISHGADMWADEDCYQLTVCYRGFTSAEAQAFLNAVNGGAFGSGLTAAELATCDALKSLLNTMHGRGDTGIWTDVWGNFDAISNWGGTVTRSATHAGHHGNSYLWFHEAAHIYFDTDNEAVAESWGNRCRRA